MPHTPSTTRAELKVKAAALKRIKLVKNSPQIELGVLLYRNLEVDTHEVTIEGKPFKLIGTDDQLTDEQRPWLHLFTGKATLTVVGGLDVVVRITGQRAPRPTLPQGRAWLIMKIGDKLLSPRLEPACGETGTGTAQYIYEI